MDSRPRFEFSKSFESLLRIFKRGFKSLAFALSGITSGTYVGFDNVEYAKCPYVNKQNPTSAAGCVGRSRQVEIKSPAAPVPRRRTVARHTPPARSARVPTYSFYEIYDFRRSLSYKHMKENVKMVDFAY
eukprot:6212245-Pleurochrysis_carterae.AAC.3